MTMSFYLPDSSICICEEATHQASSNHTPASNNMSHLTGTRHGEDRDATVGRTNASKARGPLTSLEAAAPYNRRTAETNERRRSRTTTRNMFLYAPILPTRPLKN